MANRFSIPPVNFPLHHLLPQVPFQHSLPSNPLPFIPLDLGRSGGPGSVATTSTSYSTNLETGGFEEELPLVEELGIDLCQIWRKTVSILNPIRPKAYIHEDADISGPFLYLMPFGLFQLLSGKLQFGILLGWVTVALIFLFVVFNMLAGKNGNLKLYKCMSVVGYSMLPIVVFSGVSLFVPREGVVVFIGGGVFVVWETRVCTRLLVELAYCGEERKGLIAYACFLIYSLFCLLVIF